MHPIAGAIERIARQIHQPARLRVKRRQIRQGSRHKLRRQRQQEGAIAPAALEQLSHLGPLIVAQCAIGREDRIVRRGNQPGLSRCGFRGDRPRRNYQQGLVNLSQVGQLFIPTAGHPSRPHRQVATLGGQGHGQIRQGQRILAGQVLEQIRHPLSQLGPIARRQHQQIFRAGGQGRRGHLGSRRQDHVAVRPIGPKGADGG